MNTSGLLSTRLILSAILAVVLIVAAFFRGAVHGAELASAQCSQPIRIIVILPGTEDEMPMQDGWNFAELPESNIRI